MTLIACGINHKTAPIALREQIAQSAVAPVEPSHLYSKEAALLSTCNRSEWYCSTHDVEATLTGLAEQLGLSQEAWQSYVYVHQNTAAVRHLMKVACGLDSMILGEPQILGQIKQAYRYASEQGTIGKQLGAMFRYVFSATKRVRNDTNIGQFPVSVAYTGVDLIKRQGGDLSQKQVLLIGAGETVELTARHLLQQGVGHITVANRSLDNARILAGQYGASAVTLGAIPEMLGQCDIVITATASTLPLIGKGMLETAMRQRQQRPLLLLDLAVPRDIEAEAGQLPNIALYNLDDLQAIISDNLGERRDAARQAEEIIEHEITKYIRWQRSLTAVNAVRHYREQVQLAAADERDKAIAALSRGIDPEQVLIEYGQRLTQKALHVPSVRLRQAGYDGRDDIIKIAQYLFCEKPTK